MSRTRKAVWGVALLVLVIGVGRLYLLLNPHDRVAVTVRHIHAEARFVSIAASGDRGLVSLNWSIPSEVIIPFEMHPADCLCSYPEPSRPSEVRCPVVWQEGQEYGVVTRGPNGAWRATWFPAAELPVRGRVPVFGGGRAEFDCSGRASVPLTADEVRALGLQDATDIQ
jgi:hypothetical protein